MHIIKLNENKCFNSVITCLITIIDIIKTERKINKIHIKKISDVIHLIKNKCHNSALIDITEIINATKDN